MTQKEQLSYDNIVSDILSEVPEEVSVEADFPSRGLFYELIDPSKPVIIRPMTFEDERSLASLKEGNPSKALDLLLSQCVSNLHVSQFLEMDKLYALVKIREISYGSSFDANITCPSCYEEAPISIDISKLNVNKVPEDFKDPREVHLPVCNKKAIVRFPRSSESHYLSNINNIEVHIWRFVLSIDGNTDNKVISDVIQKLPLRDMHVILNSLLEKSYGVNTRFLYVCTSCKRENEMEVPFNETFFTMS